MQREKPASVRIQGWHRGFWAAEITDIYGFWFYMDAIWLKVNKHSTLEPIYMIHYFLQIICTACWIETGLGAINSSLNKL